MMIKYSVIIPVYNSEKTIKRCLDSLLKQNRNDIEIIVINDGSIDNSQSIINQYQKKYSSIISIDQINSGVSVSRNKGLNQAIGEYILFVDSDDYVSDNYFEILDTFKDDDLYVFAKKEAGTNISDYEYFKRLKTIKSKNELVCDLIKNMRFFPPWNKRYKNNIIKKYQIRFKEEFSTGEDLNFCMEYLIHCESLNVDEHELYYLDVSDQNSLSRKYRNYLTDTLQGVYKNIEVLLLNNTHSFDRKQLIKHLDYIYTRSVYGCIVEEFKIGNKNYLKNRTRFKTICNTFKYSFLNNKEYINIVHRITRYLLNIRFYFVIYIICYLIKGRG